MGYILLTLRNASKWAGFNFGHVSGANAQVVVLLDPDTGLPVAPGFKLPRTTAVAVISPGESVSDTIDLKSDSLLAFVAPTTWSTAALNFEVSVNNLDWNVLGITDPDGTLRSNWSSLTPSMVYTVDAGSLLAWRYVRLRSGTHSSPVNQSAQCNFTIVMRALA